MDLLGYFSIDKTSLYPKTATFNMCKILLGGYLGYFIR